MLQRSLAGQSPGRRQATRVLEEMKGSDLEYVEYEQLMPFMQAGQESFLRNMRRLRNHRRWYWYRTHGSCIR